MPDDDDIDRESYYRDAHELWIRGCRGEVLTRKEQAQFRSLARDRFYTFVMSAGHSQVEGDAEKIQLLIRSLALDLVRSPGLEREWHDCEFSRDGFGTLVTAMLNEVRDK